MRSRDAYAVVALLCGACRIHFDAQSDATSGTCDTIPDLIAYFPMEAADVAGTTLRDRSGFGHDGLLVGPGLATSAGNVGDALDYRGTTASYVRVDGLPFVPGAATFALWFFRANANTASEDLVNAPQPGAVAYTLWLNSGRLCINTTSSECFGVADATLAGRWVHVAAILRDGLETGSEIFVDGQPRTLSCTGSPCTVSRMVMNPMELGSPDNYAYHGLLDEVRVYDRALSAAEIQSVFAGSACAP